MPDWNTIGVKQMHWIKFFLCSCVDVVTLIVQISSFSNLMYFFIDIKIQVEFSILIILFFLSK